MPLAVGFQRWEHLLFIHWEVDPAWIQRSLPEELTVDTFDGRAYVSLVPFRIPQSRPLVLPRALAPLLPGSSFVELNFRTYVRGPDGESAVRFFSLDASSAVAVAGARLFYRLPYFRAEMSLIDRAETVEFSSRRRAGSDAAKFEVSYRPTGTAVSAEPGSLDHFLIERYVLFAGSARGLVRAEVAHAPYLIRGADVTHLRENLLEIAGLETPSRLPVHHYAAGLDVKITAPARVIGRTTTRHIQP